MLLAEMAPGEEQGLNAGGGSLASLSEAARSKAFERYEVLRPALEDSVSLTEAARAAGVKLRTAQRWMALYKEGELVSLAPSPRTDRGHCHGLDRELEGVIEGLALKKPRPSIAAIQRRSAEIAARQGWSEPSYAQVYGLVKNLDPAMVELAHEGSKSYAQVYELLYRREAERPNEVWQADHTPLDVWIKDEKGEPRRPWLTVILDDYSRAVPGYYVGLEAPSAMGTALVLRRSILRKEEADWHICGIPETLYTDHGPDFTSRHIEQVAADIKMRLIFSGIGKPRGRGKIERFFGTVNQLFLCEQPGYAPEGSPVVRPTLTLAELDKRFRSWLIESYHHREHGETRQTPQERWEAGGFIPRMPDSTEQLDLLLLTVARSRKVGRDGIRFEGFTYLDPLLGSFIGEDVIIRYDPRDLAEISVYHKGRFLCRAISQELAEQTVSLTEIRRARDRRRRELREGVRERTSIVDTVLRLQSQPPLAPFSSGDFAPEREAEKADVDERSGQNSKSNQRTVLRRYRNE